MGKLLSKLFLLSSVLSFGTVNAVAEESPATVKMTYVNYDAPDTSYGEIAAGETAKAGFNKISGGAVNFGNTGWGVNYVTYLQVDASAIEGNITGVTLKFQASGSTDNKRATTWGVGYNSSVWSSDMTYNTADRTITTIGDTQSTTTKASTTFEERSFDITAAVNNAEDHIVTILVYETAAAGGYIKNPAVTVNWTKEAAYDVTFTETNGVAATITVNGNNVTNGTSLVNGTYDFTATAAGYKDYTGQFTVNGAAVNVEFTMTAKAQWNYTVKAYDASGNVLSTLVEDGKGLENEDVTYVYPEFYLQGTKLLSIVANSKPDPFFGKTVKLDADGKEFKVTYDGDVVSDVVFYKEAEEMEGFNSLNSNNAPIRCSNGLGGNVKEGTEVLLTTLPAGKYMIFGQVWGVAGLTAGVKVKAAGEDAEDTVLWSLESTGSLTNSTSEEFTLFKETELYVYTTGGDSKRMLDLVYIKKTGEAPVVDVTDITLSETEKALTEGETFTLTATVNPADATNPAIEWSSSDVAVATVDENGVVTAVSEGEATVTATSVADPTKTASCKVVVKKPFIAVEGITLSETTAKLEIGSTITLTATVSPENATEPAVTWSSDNTAVATVEDGVVTAVGVGEAIITAKAGEMTAECKVTVEIVTGLSSIMSENDGAVEVYDISGQKVADNLESLPAGIYIVHQGKKVVKIYVK